MGVPPQFMGKGMPMPPKGKALPAPKKGAKSKPMKGKPPMKGKGNPFAKMK